MLYNNNNILSSYFILCFFLLIVVSWSTFRKSSLLSTTTSYRFIDGRCCVEFWLWLYDKRSCYKKFCRKLRQDPCHALYLAGPLVSPNAGSPATRDPAKYCVSCLSQCTRTAALYVITYQANCQPAQRDQHENGWKWIFFGAVLQRIRNSPQKTTATTVDRFAVDCWQDRGT